MRVWSSDGPAGAGPRWCGVPSSGVGWVRWGQVCQSQPVIRRFPDFFVAANGS